ncbi:unnamed protein product [Adineta steineri]|uniref:Uncharacterized protein n=1 Tax=Adineta steineri TaxID=433720 RepID=A0A815LTC1_9BILA|nr:unnamed protein product [Adineta steineri]CAF1408459.1 unnamed protein product [Adineta steineri]
MDLVFKKKIKTLHGTSTTIISQLSNDNNNCSSYYLLHPYLVLLPGVETTFLPVRIQKSIYSSKTKIKTNRSTNIEVCGKYHDNIWGIDQEEIYSLDLWIFPMDNKIEEPIFTFEGAVIQQVQDISHLLPSPKIILNNQLNSIGNQDLIESIEPFNELTTYYAQMAIKDLDLDQQYHPLLNACRSLASTLHEGVIWHSTQLRLIQLIQRFPRLKPFLIILNKYGLHLKDILSGEKSGLDIFFGDDEIGQSFQQIKTLIRATKTQQIFHTICQHLQLQYERQTKDDNSFENYRLRIFWLTDSHCSDVLPILDLFLSLSQQTGLLIDVHYADSDPTQLANAQQTFNTHLTNQIKNLSIIYDETIDLYDSKTLEKIPFESFDIIFSSNQLQGNQDLTNSLIALRRLLVPNGLLLLLELVHVPLYFDLIFCFFDQWWSSSDDDNCALKNIQQWVILLEQIEGFHIIESTTNQNESTLIISQKTTSNDILQRLDERKNQLWLIFTKDDNNSFGHILSSLLPCSNIRIFDIRHSTFDTICFGISVLLTTYKQVSIIFAWQLDQKLLNENNDDDLALKQNEELICETLSCILQTFQKSSPYFYPFVYVLTDHAQFNNDSNLNIIASPFIGLARSLITEYERNRLKLIDLRTSLDNKLIFIHILIEYMINSRYSTNTCQVVLRLNHTNENEVQHLTWHYEMLQNNDEQKKSKLEQISIIPKRDADQKPFCICVPRSCFLSELTWIEEDSEEELLPSDMVD